MQIKSEQPSALHVHCLAHSLNLCLQDATHSCTYIREALELTREIVILIKCSAKRSHLFEVMKSQLSPETADLRPLCPTRWTARTSAIATILSFVCSGGCRTRDVCLPFSGDHEESKQTVVSFALQVAFICSGANYAQYETVLGSMGMHPVRDYKFYETIELLESHTTKLLDKQCELAKEKMKAIPSDKIGSWDRAVTVADGAWMTRGHHSQNFTFHVRDYMNNSVLYYKHLCQRGKGPLYEGTSKSMEGAAARDIFTKMKEEGMTIAVHWQDADSTAEKEVQKHFGDVTKLCGGHYTRAHYNQLKKIKGQKSFGLVDQSKYKDEFPEVLTVKCKCINKHKAGCGCFSDPFIAGARKKLFKGLDDAGKDPNALKERIEMLSHHVCDEHEWDGGQCDFHSLRECSCGECADGNLNCNGKEYKTRLKLSCPYHTLAYGIELNNRSKQAEKVIDKDLGRGHTNQLESANNALIRFRKKNWNIKRVHYHASTNLGLLESNLTFMHKMKGVQYHWLPELYEELGVPDFDGVKAYYKMKNRGREKLRLKRQTTEHKKQRYTAKHYHRTTEQLQRQEHNQQHSYKSEVGLSIEPHTAKPCECGSTDHVRKTHRNCPLNPRNAANAPSTSKQACSRSTETDDEQQDSESDYGEGSDNNEPLVKRCTSCGSTGHACKSHKSCPKNPRNAPTEDPSSRSAEADEELSDFEGFEPDNGEVSSYEDLVSDMQGSSDEEEKVVEICDCGRAHKRDCPLNPRHRKAYSGKQKMQLTKRRDSSLGFAVSGKGKGKACAARRTQKRKPFNPPRRKRLFEDPSSRANGSAKRVCLAQTAVDPESDCLLTRVEPSQDIFYEPT